MAVLYSIYTELFNCYDKILLVVFQEEAWKTHVFKKDRDKPKSQERSKRKFGFRELAR